MSLHIYNDLIQGTDEWLAARRGIVTASVVGQLLSVSKPGAQEYDCPNCGAAAGDPCLSRAKKEPTPIKTLHAERADVAAENAATAPDIVTVAKGDTARSLTLSLVAERITGWTEPTYMNSDMERGVFEEPLARNLYSETYEPVTEVGFMVREFGDAGHKLGYSPDGLVGDDGLIAGAIEVKSRRQKKQLATILADTVPVENMAQLQCGLLVSGRKWIDYVSYSGGMPMWTKRVHRDVQWFGAIVQALYDFETTAAEMVATYNERVAGLPVAKRIDMEIVI